MFEAEYEMNEKVYGHQTNWKGTGHHKGEGSRAWNYKEFISFDGEGVAID
jgi:hypothetical protein